MVGIRIFYSSSLLWDSTLSSIRDKILLTLTLGSRDHIHLELWLSANYFFECMMQEFTHCHLTILKFPLFQMDRLFPPRPATQLVLRTWARDATGFPAILIALLTRLGYRWYPEYMVYEDYRKFNQEQYHADVRIFDQRDNSDSELHTFHGIGVTIEMAIHDAAHSAVARLHSEHSRLDASKFRYIPYAPAGDGTGYYTAVCAPYE
jgi:hypothetical protein